MESYSERYQRQIQLLGKETQQKFANTRVLVIGAGGLGSPLLYYLAAAGVGKLRIVDGDVVSASNLNRQILYTASDIGKQKAACAALRLQELDPTIEVEAVTTPFEEETAGAFLKDCDVVALAVDDLQTRVLANMLCCLGSIPLVDAGAGGYGGYVATMVPPKTHCLLSYLHDRPFERTNIQTLGAAAGIIGAMEAMAVLRLLAGKQEAVGKIFFFDGSRWSGECVPFPDYDPCLTCKVHFPGK